MPLSTHDLERLPDAETRCLRCDVPMKAAGDAVLAGAPFTETVPMWVGWTRFEVHICPRCGKTELFL